MAFHIAQVQEAQAKTPVALIVRKSDQMVGNFGIFRRQPRPVAIAVDANLEGLACQFDAGSTRANGTLRHLSQPRWLHHHAKFP